MPRESERRKFACRPSLAWKRVFFARYRYQAIVVWDNPSSLFDATYLCSNEDGLKNDSALNGIRTLTPATPVQCSSIWAFRRTGAYVGRDYNPVPRWPDSWTGGAVHDEQRSGFESNSALSLNLENSHYRLTDHVTQTYLSARRTCSMIIFPAIVSLFPGTDNLLN